MWERIKRVGHVLSEAGNVADWTWRCLVLVFGLTTAGVIAWASTTWTWYWTTFDWAGAAIAFLVAYVLIAIATLIYAVASSYLRRGVGPVSASQDDGPLTWFYYNLSLEGGPLLGRPVYTLKFKGTNSSQREVELLSADITSAINGSRLP